jgi:hypothetical protein
MLKLLRQGIVLRRNSLIIKDSNKVQFPINYKSAQVINFFYKVISPNG